MKTLTIRHFAMAVVLLLPTLFQSCSIKDMFEELENREEEDSYYSSYSNEIGGKTTEYGTSSWAAMADKAPFINKFEAVGSDLNYSSLSTGVRDGERVEEVRFERATTDDEAATYIKKMIADGYVFTFGDGALKGYKIDSEGVRYEMEYGYNQYCYRKTEISSQKKDSAAKLYSDELKNQSGTKVYTNWAQVAKDASWLQIFPEAGGVYTLSKASGNEVKLYGDISYETIDKLVENALANGFSSFNWGESYEKEINGNRYVLTTSYDVLTFQRILADGSNGNNDIPDNSAPSGNQENNSENGNGEAPVDGGTPEENNGENGGENNNSDNGENNGNQQTVSADDFNADGDIDWRDKFYKIVANSGVSTHTRKTYNGEVSLYNFTSVYGAIQVYDSAAGYEPNQYYYDLSVDGGLMYQYEKGAWRFKSRIYKDRNKPADEGFKSQFSTLVYFAPPSWGVADLYLGTSVFTKVGSKTYAGRACTEYTYNNYQYYIDNETDVCLYYNGAGVEFETLDFTVGAKLSVPNYRRYQADFPTNVQIATTETAFGMTTNLTIIKLGSEWMCTDGKGTYQYWKFDSNGVTLKAMVKDEGDESWTSVLDDTHWQDFDYFAQKCDFSFIFSNSTPKGTCYSECNPTSETLTVCGVECVKYTGTSALNTSYDFYVNESNNVVYKAKDISASEITSWSTSVTSFEISAP